MSAKLRVLCLHGYRQTGEKLRVRISGFRRAFKSNVEFVCVDAPLIVPYEPTSEEHAKSEQERADNDDVELDKRQFSWWNYHRDAATGAQTYSNVEGAIECVAAICREQGPFDGIFGFSQGGMLASFVLQRQHESPESWPFAFAFGIFAAAPQAIDPRFMKSGLKLTIPSLHIIGEGDTIVAPERCEQLADGFINATVLRHSGGHYIPTGKDSKDALREFFKQLAASRT